MAEITVEQERYLLAAFTRSPRDWFRPQQIGLGSMSEEETAQIVAGLAAEGMLDAQPDCHARLTPLGRKEAERLTRSGGQTATRSLTDDRRRSRRRYMVLGWVVFLGLLAALRWKGFL